LGYVYREGVYGFARVGVPTVVHDVDVGVDYSRPLSRSRRTTLDFAVGTSIVDSPDSQTSTTSTVHYRPSASVGLNHAFGRTWRARGVYTRGVIFSEAFLQPGFSDVVDGSIVGFFSRRVDFNAQGGFSMGDVGFSTQPSDYRAYSASSRLRVAVQRNWAWFVGYQFYRHNTVGAPLANGVPPRLNRNVVRTGIELWLPVFGRRQTSAGDGTSSGR
jgi:hypothetical protein